MSRKVAKIRYEKPVYINTSLWEGTYKEDGVDKVLPMPIGAIVAMWVFQNEKKAKKYAKAELISGNVSRNDVAMRA